MSDAAGMELGPLQVTIGGELDPFNKSVKEMEDIFASTVKTVNSIIEPLSHRIEHIAETLETWGRKLTFMGAELAAIPTEAAHFFAKQAEDLENMALRTGIEATALSELGTVAAASGNSLEGVEHALRRMQMTLSREGENKAFHGLGLSLAELKKAKPEEQFFTLLDALRKIDDPTKQVAATMRVFGRDSTRMIPMIKMGSEGIKEMMEHHRELGITMMEDSIKAGGEFHKSLEVSLEAMKAINYAVGEEAMPLLKAWADWVKENTKYLIAFIREHGNWVRVMLAVGSTLVTVGGALFTAGAAMKMFNVAMAAGPYLMGAMRIASMALATSLKEVAYWMGFVTGSTKGAAAGGLLAGRGGLVGGLALAGTTAALNWESQKDLYGGMSVEGLRALIDRTQKDILRNQSLGNMSRVAVSQRVLNSALTALGAREQTGTPGESSVVGVKTRPEITKGMFKQMSLNRFSLATPEGVEAGTGGEQKVKAFGVETRLDTIAAILRGQKQGLQ